MAPAQNPGERLTRERAPQTCEAAWSPLVGLVVVLVIAVAIAVAALNPGGDQATDAQDAATGPATQPVDLQPHQVVVAGPGILRAARSIGVTPPTGVGGTVASIRQVGERVETGDELARLDPEPFERALREAEIGLERAESSLATLEANQSNAQAAARQESQNARSRAQLAQREVERLTMQLELTNRLLELGSESPAAVSEAQDALADAREELESARTALADLQASQSLQERVRAQERRDAELNVSQAQLDLEEAQENLASLTIVAPFTAIVSEVEVSEGSSVSENTSLLTLIDDAVLDMPVQVDETEIASVTVGQDAVVRLDARPDGELPGSVTAISPVARLENNIPIFDVTVTIENPDLTVRPGMTAEAQIEVARYDEAVMVPNAALQQTPSPSVLVVRDGEEQQLPVQIVDSVGFTTIVTGGFEEGDELIVGPANAGESRRSPGISITFDGGAEGS